MNRRIFLLSLVVLPGCEAFDKLIGVAGTTISIPVAREELLNYLTDEEEESIKLELAVLDSTYQPIADAVFGNSSVSLEEALASALDSAINRAELEKAYKAIRAVVKAHRDDTGEAVPVNLSRVSGELEALWESWKDVIEANQRAVLYLEIIAKLALPT